MPVFIFGQAFMMTYRELIRAGLKNLGDFFSSLILSEPRDFDLSRDKSGSAILTLSWGDWYRGFEVSKEEIDAIHDHFSRLQDSGCNFIHRSKHYRISGRRCFYFLRRYLNAEFCISITPENGGKAVTLMSKKRMQNILAAYENFQWGESS